MPRRVAGHQGFVSLARADPTPGQVVAFPCPSFSFAFAHPHHLTMVRPCALGQTFTTYSEQHECSMNGKCDEESNAFMAPHSLHTHTHTIALEFKGKTIKQLNQSTNQSSTAPHDTH